MEMPKSKQNNLFQSVASKLSRFFKRESPAVDLEPNPEDKTSAQPEAPVAAEESKAPVAESPEIEPVIVKPEEEKRTEPKPEVAPELAVTPDSQTSLDEKSASQPTPKTENEAAVKKHVPAPKRAQKEEAAEPASDAPAPNFSASVLASKRRLHISDLSRNEAEMLLSSYVQEHISDEQLSVDTMAAQLKVSRTGLYQLVHEIYGVTPANFIMDLRLKYASDLLMKGKKVREVSSKCGFSDPKYFSKVFKKYYGVLPSNYCAAE